ncbi:D(1)-like dopamine receptor [Menidia menidia]
MPWRALSEVAGAWLFGRFCDTWVAFDIMCSTASILNLCLISLDRYWAIASPFRYERRMTRRLALLMIGVAWTLSVLISFIPVRLNWHRARVVEEEDGEDGDEEDEGCNATLNRTYAIASSLISFYIPVLIMVGTYTRIFRIAQTQIRRISSLERAAAAGPRARARHRHSSSAHAHEESSLKTTFKRETKVLKTLSVIVGVFVFCWLPFFVLNCVVPFCGGGGGGGGAHAHAPPCVSDATFSIFVWFGWANSSVNPVIYAFNADFRRAFSSLLGCGRATAVRPVDFSDELASYHHDTTAGGGGVRAAPAPAPAQTPPPPQPAEPQNPEVASDQRNPLLPAIRRFDGEPEISLDMMPFNCSDPHGWVIPGQRNPLLPAIRRFDGEPEISLDMMPFNCSDPHGWVIPGQRNPLLPAIRRFDGEPEISLDMMPFNCSDPHGWVIPGQVQDP